ncbi:MAG: MATE family efflux transporter, partial [Lachnospiraceae bacterium]|nr:MATE family efflux transporter [Lachnospiraceae bacterium]
MTKGRPLSLLITFAFPLLLGNLLQQTYSLTDTAIVGKLLGAGPLAAVGATASVQFLVLGFAMGTCTGLGIP